MSEYPFDRPAALVNGECNWCFDPVTGDDTVGPVPSPPDASRRLNGWHPTNPEKPAAPHLNYVLREASRGVTYLDAIAIRRFQRLDEAIAATKPDDLFYLQRPGFRRNGGLPDTRVFADDVQCHTTDGERVYVAFTSGEIVACMADDLTTELWRVEPVSGIPPYAMHADGQALFAVWGHASVTTDNIQRIDRDDGSTTHSITGEPSLVPWVRSNGDRVVVTHGASRRSLLMADAADLDNSSATTNIWSPVDSAGGITQFVVTGDMVICVGTPNGGVLDYTIQAFSLSGGSSVFGFSFLDGAPPTAIAYDGDYYYVATGWDDGGFGTDHHVYAFSPLSTTPVWGAHLDAGSVAALAIGVDDRYVYAMAAGYLGYLDKRTGTPLARVSSAMDTSDALRYRCLEVDGRSVVVAYGDEIRRYPVAGSARLYQRAYPTDTRRPFAGLAIPL